MQLCWFILVSLLLISDEVWCGLFELTFIWGLAGLGGEDHI
jgi:hypothetical protein